MTRYVRSARELPRQDKSDIDSAVIQVEVADSINPAEKIHQLVEAVLNEANNNNKIDIVKPNLGTGGPEQESLYPAVYVKNDYGMSVLKILFIFRISTHPDSDNSAGRARFTQTQGRLLSRLPANQKAQQEAIPVSMIVYNKPRKHNWAKPTDIVYSTFEEARTGIPQYIESQVQKYKTYDANLFYAGYNIKKVGKNDWIIVSSEGDKISKHFYSLEDIKKSIDAGNITASQYIAVPITDKQAKYILNEVKKHFRNIVPYNFYIADVFQELTVDDIYLEIRDSADNSYEGFIPVDEYLSNDLSEIIDDIIRGFTETYHLYSII